MPDYSKVLSDAGRLSYHQQEYPTWCGAACAQMILHSLAPGPTLRRQDDLKLALQSAPRCKESDITWASAPDALTKVLNDKSPRPSDLSFHLVRGQTQEETTRRIIWNIERFGVAAIALVHGFQHWVVVQGFTTSQQPQGPDDTSYNIVSLDLYDPAPPMPSGRIGKQPEWPPPHTPGDRCSSGGLHGNDLVQVTYERWAGVAGNTNDIVHYMTGISPSIVSTWSGLFLAICIALPGEDPTDVGCGQVMAALAADGPGTSEQTGSPQPGDRGENMDDNHEGTQESIERTYDARVSATEGLRTYGLYDRPDWRETTATAVPGEPLVVERLDDPKSSYLIVPFSSAKGTPLVVSLDAATGRYLQAAAASNTEANVHPILSSDTIKANLLAGPISVGKMVIVVDPAQLPEGNLPLVWKPCLESFSPFVPFYRVTLEVGQDPLTLYIRASDGAAFARLTDNVGGA